MVLLLRFELRCIAAVPLRKLTKEAQPAKHVRSHAMRPAPQTVRAVEAASALYGAPVPHSTQLRDTRPCDAASSDDEDDDGWVPVPLEVVTTWKAVAITAAAVDRGASLDITALALASGASSTVLSLADKVSAMRVVKSSGNLAGMLAPPAPAPRLPPFVVASPSQSAGSASPRCASQRAPWPPRRLRALPVSPTGSSGGRTSMARAKTALPRAIPRFARTPANCFGARHTLFHLSDPTLAPRCPAG